MSDRPDVTVAYAGGDSFEIAIRGHRVIVDQPSETGGDDRGPTPTELFVASLVSCMGFFAQRFLRRNGVDPDGLELVARIATAERPHRVGSIGIELVLPPMRGDLVEPLRRVVEHCTVHNSLVTPPEITLSMQHVDPSPGGALSA